MQFKVGISTICFGVLRKIEILKIKVKDITVMDIINVEFPYSTKRKKVHNKEDQSYLVTATNTNCTIININADNITGVNKLIVAARFKKNKKNVFELILYVLIILSIYLYVGF